MERDALTSLQIKARTLETALGWVMMAVTIDKDDEAVDLKRKFLITALEGFLGREEPDRSLQPLDEPCLRRLLGFVKKDDPPAIL
jgi:hypothetical protein